MPSHVRMSMLNQNSFIFFCLFMSLLLVGCKEKAKENQEAFFKQPFPKQHEMFLAMPLVQQYEIYIYAMTNRHPQDLSFADDIADSQREKAIPFLVDKLRLEKEEGIQQKIIFIFERIARHKIDLTKDKDLMQLLETVISSMKQPYYIKLSKESLGFIKAHGK